MDNPGVSLFNNGTSLHFDVVNQQEAEEEEDEAEEQKRIQAELQANLHGAFDDLDLDDDEDEDDDDEGGDSSGDTVSEIPQQILTPGQVPLKHVTSTPFNNHNYQQASNAQRFHQLQAEVTCDEEEETLTHGDEAQNVRAVNPAYYNNHQDAVNAYNQRNQFPEEGQHAGGTGHLPLEQYGAVQPHPSLDTRHQIEYFNKSDSEKVKENEHLFSMYTARGRQIEQLQAEVDSLRKENSDLCEQLNSIQTEHASQLRQLRQHLASTAVEKEQLGSSLEKLEQLLADSKRENQLLKDEIHPLKERVVLLQEAKDSLEVEHTGDKESIVQLQQKIRQLETTDTVLRARQQYDALVRSIKERHDDEVQKLRMEVDRATSLARDRDQEAASLRDKLSKVQNSMDFMVTEKASLIEELNSKLNENQKKLMDLQSNDQAAEVTRLHAALKSSESEVTRLQSDLRTCGSQVTGLRAELAGYEAMGVQELSESVIDLGLGTSRSDGTTRLKEELHRSLTGNKSKREQISRLELQLFSKNEEIDRLNSDVNNLKMQIDKYESVENEKARESEEAVKHREESLKLKSEVTRLEAALKHAEEQNVKVKKCMTELLEGNQEDKMEAIDSLREEYEEHCRNAVEQTKSLMEGEVRRLQIELDVYNKTVVELRKKLDTATQQNSQKTSQDDIKKIEDLEKRVENLLSDKTLLESQVQALESEKRENLNKIQTLQSEVIKLKEVDEDKLPKQIEAVLESRVEDMRTQLREIWDNNRKGDIEEAVAAARLDWLKRLPEAEKPGGAARLSINQVQQLQEKLSQAAKEREQLQLEVSQQIKLRNEVEAELERLRGSLADLRQEMFESETKFDQELRTALTNQANQWQERLTATRQQEESQRRQIESRYESDYRQLEDRMRQRDKETAELEARLEQVETEYSLAKEKWRRVLEDKNQSIQSLRRNNSGDIEMLKSELARRVEEVDRQRAEMAGMADRWTQEVKSIQEAHLHEKKELAEMTEKYQSLKSKVRKYQRHVEQKVNHYKQENTRLENEFKSTLERLQERMELTYSAKEKEVEKQLGNMRSQFTQELHNIATRREKTGGAAAADQQRPQTPNLLISGSPDQQLEVNNGVAESLKQQLVVDSNIESESLKQYYVHTSRQIQQLLK